MYDKQCFFTHESSEQLEDLQHQTVTRKILCSSSCKTTTRLAEKNTGGGIDDRIIGGQIRIQCEGISHAPIRYGSSKQFFSCGCAPDSCNPLNIL